MLVISRRKNETLHIYAGDHKIKVKVADVVGNKVRLGIDAEATVMILREEIDTPENRGVLADKSYTPGYRPKAAKASEQITSEG